MNLHGVVQRIEGEFKGETTRIEPLVGRGGDPTRMDVLQRAETVTKHGATDDEEGEYYEWLDATKISGSASVKGTCNLVR